VRGANIAASSASHEVDRDVGVTDLGETNRGGGVTSQDQTCHVPPNFTQNKNGR